MPDKYEERRKYGQCLGLENKNNKHTEKMQYKICTAGTISALKAGLSTHVYDCLTWVGSYMALM